MGRSIRLGGGKVGRESMGYMGFGRVLVHRNLLCHLSLRRGMRARNSKDEQDGVMTELLVQEPMTLEEREA